MTTTSGEKPFARLLKKYRVSAGLTQEELAEKAGLSGRAISDLERGVNKIPRRDTLDLLLGALQLAPGDRETLEAAAKQLLSFSEPTPAVNLSQPEIPASKTLILPTHPHNLPLSPTSLIGREQSLATLQENLNRPQVRLLTLTGPGGIGKTRLALQLAWGSLAHFKDGVFFVDLSPINNPALALSKLSQVLRVRQINSQDLLETVKEYLRDKQILLVLDNLEQLLELAPDISSLLDTSAGLKVLATSRERLHLRYEKEFILPALELPDPQNLPPLEKLLAYKAVALFNERALNSNPDFKLTSANARAIGEICYQLDGLPLAIELAAVHTRKLSPQAIFQRLKNRLQLLTHGFRDLPLRHQTLRATIAWSYDLLAPDERHFFEQLGVFAGSFRHEAVEAVCRVKETADAETDLLPSLMALADKSLLTIQEQPNGEPNFRMLATIREFALERLGASEEVPTTRKRHAAYYLTLAEQAELKFRGPEEAAMLNYLDFEHDNFREALTWALKNDLDLAGRIGGALWFYWEPRGYLIEGKRWLETILRQNEVGEGSLSPAVRARVLRGVGWLSVLAGEFKQARQFLTESLELFRGLDNNRDIARVLNNLSHLLLIQGNYQEASVLLDENLTLMRTFEDKVGLGRLLQMRAWASSDLGDHAQTRILLEESLQVLGEAGDRLGIGYSIHNLGWSSMVAGDYEEAERLLSQGLEIFQSFGERLAKCIALTNLAWNNLEKGEYGLAESLFLESLAIIKQLESRHRVLAETLEGLAYLEGVNGAPEQTARLLGTAQLIRENILAPIPPAIQARYDRTVALARSRLDPYIFEREWANGRNIAWQEILRYVHQAVKPAT